MHWFRWSLLLLVASISGCGGCRKPIDRLSKEELDKRAKEQREAIQIESLLALPSDSESNVITVKPGHWVETVQRVKSTREDLQVVAIGDVARGTEQVSVPGTNIINEFARPTVLPKGQWKSIDLQFFVPASGKSENQFDLISSKLQLRSKIVSRQFLTPIVQMPYDVNELGKGQCEIVVLTPQPLNYEYMAALDTVIWRRDEDMSEERTRSYHITLMKPVDGKLAMPSSMISMTAIAAIIWDDLSSDDLSAEQKIALVDWIHWGGQLIVSGPGSWSRLQGSFLSPLLPVISASPVELSTKDFEGISDKWIVEDLARPEREKLEIVGTAIPGLKFTLAENSQWVPWTGELLAERSVGRGRIVASSFPLREPRIYRWKYFSSFFSTAILRRPARTVVRENSINAQRWASPYDRMESDPRLNTNLRIASRDIPFSASSSIASTVQASANPAKEPPRATSRPYARPPFPFEEQDSPPLPPKVFASNSAESVQWSDNGSAWNDLSGLSFQAINTLRSAAGIELPERITILWLLVGYLACLVPLNWLVFRAIGRLEWAWIAAPIIAVAGVVIVTRVARLDIGFARRNSEIALLELQGEHPRGHLTRFVALYTSLSTNYAMELPEPGSVALPLGDMSRRQRRVQSINRNLRSSFGSTAGMRLEPLTVYSNSTEMVHAEQMVSFPKGMAYTAEPDTLTAKITNGTDLNLRSGILLRFVQPAGLQLSWLGDLAAGESAKIQFASASLDDAWQHWNESPITCDPRLLARFTESAGAHNDAIRLGAVLSELTQKVPLVEGQTRLFAYADQRPGKLLMEPAEDQLDSRCVVMAHLTSATLGSVTPDLRILSRPISSVMAPPQPVEPADPN